LEFNFTRKGDIQDWIIVDVQGQKETWCC